MPSPPYRSFPAERRQRRRSSPVRRRRTEHAAARRRRRRRPVARASAAGLARPLLLFLGARGGARKLQASAINTGVKAAALDEHLSSSVCVEHVACLVDTANRTVTVADQEIPGTPPPGPRFPTGTRPRLPATPRARAPGLFGSPLASQASQTPRVTAAVTADVTLLATTAVGSIVNV